MKIQDLRSMLLQIRLQFLGYFFLRLGAPSPRRSLTYSFFFHFCTRPSIYLSQCEATIAFHIFSFDIEGISFCTRRRVVVYLMFCTIKATRPKSLDFLPNYIMKVINNCIFDLFLYTFLSQYLFYLIIILSLYTL